MRPDFARDAYHARQIFCFIWREFVARHHTSAYATWMPECRCAGFPKEMAFSDTQESLARQATRRIRRTVAIFYPRTIDYEHLNVFNIALKSLCLICLRSRSITRVNARSLFIIYFSMNRSARRIFHAATSGARPCRRWERHELEHQSKQ